MYEQVAAGFYVATEEAGLGHEQYGRKSLPRGGAPFTGRQALAGAEVATVQPPEANTLPIPEAGPLAGVGGHVAANFAAHYAELQ